MNFKIGVFQGFIGVIAFMAYALPLMLVTCDMVLLTGRVNQGDYPWVRTD